MLFLLLVCVCWLTIIISADDVGRTIPQLIESRGFNYETHKIVTEDKYVLTSFRIINPYIARTNLRPVFLQHGITASAANYLVNAEGFINSSGVYTENGGTIINRCDIFSANLNLTIGRTLPFVLSACGYDVWLGNNRGNSYSNVNLVIPNILPRFWEYSFQQMAFYDIPASLSYILSITNRTSLAYIGHSQGTTQMFALLSARPEYSKIINLFVALAPVVYLNYVELLFKTAAFLLADLFRSFPAPIGSAPNQLEDILIEILCPGSGNTSICVASQSPNINMSRAGIYASVNDIASTWSFAHYFQIMNSGDFVRFDYGSPLKNIQQYGTIQVPIFKIDAITSKRIALFYGDNDTLADVNDVQLLIQRLNVTLLDNYLVPFNGWTHIDFVVSKYTGSLINPKILGLLNQTSNTCV